MFAVGQAHGQLTCSHTERGTDYPDGDYMTSTSTDPCGEGSAILLSRQNSNNDDSRLTTGSRLEDSISQAVFPGLGGRSEGKESLPTAPFVISSNTWTIRRSKG